MQKTNQYKQQEMASNRTYYRINIKDIPAVSNAIEHHLEDLNTAYREETRGMSWEEIKQYKQDDEDFNKLDNEIDALNRVLGKFCQ